MNLASLKTYIYNRLVAVSGLPVYSVQAPTNSVCPYLTYTFTSMSQMMDNEDTRVLEINYWDDKSDDTDILAASELVRQNVDKMWETELEGFFRCFIDWEGELPDVDFNISRIQQRYIIKARRL